MYRNWPSFGLALVIPSVGLAGRGYRRAPRVRYDKLYLFGTMEEARDTWYEPETWPHLMQSRFAEFAGPARTFLDSWTSTPTFCSPASKRSSLRSPGRAVES
jgi:hypothetical protein